MADGTILSTVGKRLATLLETEGKFGANGVVPGSPGAAAHTGKISLFLYQIQENAYLRNQAMAVVNDPLNDTTTWQPPPLTLDLYYLVTALDNNPENAMGDLEKVMLTFHDHGVLKDTDLSPTLIDAGNQAIRIVPHPLSVEEMNRLWSMFPNKAYQLSVAYLVTPVDVPSTKKTVKMKKVQKEGVKIKVDHKSTGKMA